MTAPNSEFWAKLTMETVEHHIGLSNPRNRVFFAIIRFSSCYPHLSPFAVRPRLPRGGLADCIAQLHERISKERPVRADDISGEMADTDTKTGRVIPLSQQDLELITGLRKSHVSEALQKLKADGLIQDRFPFYPVAKPSVIPPFPPRKDKANEVPCTGNSEFDKSFQLNTLLNKVQNILGVPLRCKVNGDLDAQERAVRFLESLRTDFHTGLSERRAELRKRVIRDGTGNGILIERKRSKNRETSSSDGSVHDRKPTTTTESERPSLENVTEALMPYGTPDDEKVRELIQNCRQQAPDSPAARSFTLSAKKPSF